MACMYTTKTQRRYVFTHHGGDEKPIHIDYAPRFTFASPCLYDSIMIQSPCRLWDSRHSSSMMPTNHPSNDHPLNEQECRLLALLKPDELHFLQSIVTKVELPAQAVLLKEGEHNHFLYFIHSGTLHISKQYHGKTFDIGAVTPGQILGEASVLFHDLTRASVTSIEACTLYQVEIQYIQELIQDNARFNHAIHQIAEQRSAASTLAVNPIFGTLPQVVRETILYNAEFTDIEAGETLVQEGGNDTQFLYIILSGTAEVSIRHPSRPEEKVTFATLQSGDEVGEMAIVTEKPHAASVVALSTLRLLKISTASMHIWMERHPTFTEALKASIQSKLQHNLKALRQ